jgi:RNA polymerase-binding protein DksA
VTTIDTDRFRELLLEERGRVVAAIEYLHEEAPAALDTESEEVPSGNHPADLASPTLDREIDYTLEENSEQVLREIDDALSRIEKGTYGTCQSCGKEISVERLEAIPFATQCIDCRRRDERG